MLKRYGIYAPVLGEREDFPVILLKNAITRNNTRVQIWNGEIRKAKLRSNELIKAQHAISALDTSADTISITGDVTAHYPNAANVTIYNQSDDSYENHTLSTTSTFNGTSTVLTVTGDITVSSPDEYCFNSEDVGSSDPANVDFLKVKFPDTYPALRYDQLILSDGTERLVGFTNAHIYYWDTILTKWRLLFTCSSDCTYWDAAQYGDNLAATNNIDRPIYWDGNTANDFENVDTQLTSTTSNYIAKAKFVASYHNYLILGNVTLQDGTRYQHYMFTSNIGEGVLASGFRQDQSKDAGAYYIEGRGEITGGFGKWQGYLIVFKRFSHRKVWFVGGTIPLSQDEQSPDVGCTAPGSVGNDPDGNLYYYGSDKAFREVNSGKISYGIDDTARAINPSLVEGIRFIFVDEYGEIRWAVPYGNSATANNKIIVYKEGRWDTDIDIAVTAFGKYTRQTSYTWKTVTGTWASSGIGKWNSVRASSDFPISLCSDSSGFTYNLIGAFTDNGSTYNSSFEITTDLGDKQTLMNYKRINQIYCYVRKKSSGTLNLYVKKDSESSFNLLGGISMQGDEDILRVRLPVNLRARHFLFKPLSTSDFAFIGMEFEFLLQGTR